MTEKSRLTRREIIAAAGAVPLAAGAARALAQEAQGQPLMGNPNLPQAPGERLGWAIVGLGSYGTNQVIPAFAESRLAKMTAFVSGNPDKARRFGAAYGVSKFYDYANYDSMKNDEAIDCVYIVLPVGLHAEYTIRALEAGKHVLCEKPSSCAANCRVVGPPPSVCGAPLPWRTSVLPS